MPDLFDPYHKWLGIPPGEQPANHYRLLGITVFEPDPDVIQAAADQRMAHLRTFQSGRRGPLSQKLLNEVAAAKISLLNEAKRAAYDAELRSRLVAHTQPASPGGTTDGEADGTVFGEYVLLDRLGTGRTGQVFKARHRTMGRTVALKVLSAAAGQSPAEVERFRRKVKLLARLSHVNLVTAHDAGQRDGTYYLVMEHVDGPDLGAVVTHYGPLPVGHALGYCRQAAAGLGHAHSHGVWHRNVKPANLLVDRQGVVKVIGLGLARVGLDELADEMGFEGELTLTGQVVGSMDTMAPEQTMDSRRVDHRADIYALGCTLFTLLVGHPPFPAKSHLEKITAHRETPPPSLFEHRPDTPFPLDSLFRRMLAKDPDQRPQSMEEVIAGLDGCR